jgi:hypothetical protein
MLCAVAPGFSSPSGQCHQSIQFTSPEAFFRDAMSVFIRDPMFVFIKDAMSVFIRDAMSA